MHMMLDDRSRVSIKLEAQRDDASNQGAANGVNFALASHGFAPAAAGNSLGAHLHNSHLEGAADLLASHQSQPLSGSPTGSKIAGQLDHQFRQQQQQLQVQANFRDHQRPQQQQQHHQQHPHQHPHHQHPHQHHQQQQHQHQHQQLPQDEQYPTSDETNSSSYNLNSASTPAAGSGAHYLESKSGILSASHSSPNLADEQEGRHSLMVPATAHSSDQLASMHYSLSGAVKSLPTTSPSGMALNFSHDLSHGQSSSSSHQQTNGGGGGVELKPHQLGAGLELEPGSHLMQTAANMNMWKSTMGLGFKHSAIGEHGFLPGSEMNAAFPSWPHAANSLASHQAAPGVGHHILDGQHLIGYPQHGQRSLQLPHHHQQDLVGASLKSQVCAEQASLIFNQVSQQAQMGAHHGGQQANEPANLHPRSQAHDATSYNLSMNDNQFYNNRSHHGNTIKSSAFLHDRSGPSHAGNQAANHLAAAYHSADQLCNQSANAHLVPGSSVAGSSRNVGTFKCPHCSEIFSMRNQYQSHVKSHSQEKGATKPKFHCELCGHSFSQKTSLNRHMKSHTGERPFPCEVCGKAFSEKERLKIHMRTHTGEKPFSCGICGKSFSQKSTVKRHQTVHTGEKKFKCDCGKGFANRGNLIAHIKTRGSNHFE